MPLRGSMKHKNSRLDGSRRSLFPLFSFPFSLFPFSLSLIPSFPYSLVA
jgi:hypothetical protein